MTVATTHNRNSYSCDGSRVIFPYTFKIFQDSDLDVKLRDTNGIETTLTLTTDYTVSGAGAAAGGNVTTVATYATGNSIVILRQIPLTQLTDYVENDPFLAATHENAIDRAIMLSQQLDEENARAIKMPESSPLAGAALEITEGALANKVIGFDAGGTAIELKSTGTISNPDFYVIGDYNNDLVQAVSDIGSSVVTLLINIQVNVTANVTVPSNIYLWFLNEGSLNISSGIVATISGGMNQDLLTQRFKGLGTVDITESSLTEVYPEWWGAVADGVTDSTVAINAAIAASLGIITRLHSTLTAYMVSAPIIVYSLTRLIGTSPSVSGNERCLIKLMDNSDSNVIQNDQWVAQSDWWTWGEIAYLGIDGNKANNAAPSSGIAIYQMGETSQIHHVHIINCNDNGIHIKGTSAPCKVSKFTINNCDGAGFYSEQGGAAVTTIEDMSGDHNAIFIKADGAVSLLVLNPKIEGSTDTVFDFRFDDLGGNLTNVIVVGGYANGAAGQTNIFYIDGAAAATVSIILMGFRQFNYTNLINDQDIPLTIATGGRQSWEGIHLYRGDVNLMAAGTVKLPFNNALVSETSLGGTEVNMILQASNALQIRSGVGGGIILYDSGGNIVLGGKANQGYTPGLRVGGTDLDNFAAQLLGGSGTPEGNVTAGVGSIYLRSDGGAVTSFYVKESGAGNTGWVAK